RRNAPQAAARNDDVVAVAVLEPSPVAIELARALVDEEELIAILVAHQMVHRDSGLPIANLDIAVAHERRRIPRRPIFRRQLVEIVGVRIERTGEGRPSRGRVFVVEMRGRSEEAFLPHFAFERPLRQIGVRLPAMRAVGAGESDVVLHARSPDATTSSRAAAIAVASTSASPIWLARSRISFALTSALSPSGRSRCSAISCS